MSLFKAAVVAKFYEAADIGQNTGLQMQSDSKPSPPYSLFFCHKAL